MIGFYNEEPKSDEDIKNKHQALIYKHWDGYPTYKDENGTEYGVIAILEDFLTKFNKGRGLTDIEYASARTLQHLCNMSDNPNDTYGSNFLGYGIAKEVNHTDIEFFYAVYPKAFKAYAVQRDYETRDENGEKTYPLSFSELHTIEIKEDEEEKGQIIVSKIK